MIRFERFIHHQDQEETINRETQRAGRRSKVLSKKNRKKRSINKKK